MAKRNPQSIWKDSSFWEEAEDGSFNGVFELRSRLIRMLAVHIYLNSSPNVAIRCEVYLMVPDNEHYEYDLELHCVEGVRDGVTKRLIRPCVEETARQLAAHLER